MISEILLIEQISGRREGRKEGRKDRHKGGGA